MENNNGKKRSGLFFYLLFMLVLLGSAILFERCYSPSDIRSYSEYREDLDADRIGEARIVQNKQTPTGKIYYKFKEADEQTNYRVVNISDVQAEQAALLEAGVAVNLEDVQTDSVFITTILPVVLAVIGVLFILSFVFRATNASGGGQMSQMQNFTKNRARLQEPGKNPVTFKDVAGLVEEKEELEEVVDFLKNPGKYTELGARIPKGMILVGPPGTGKTLLAKAVAGEAKVPFFSISGSDFVEMFVGVGASRVRDLFADAKKNAPCIVFIDEIDAVGRVRGSGMGGGHDEREQTLNQLLVEMDGFSVNQGIIVMAATNRVDILDPAILRPGRFDRKVAVGYPDIKGREEILKVHVRNKKLSDDVDLHTIARTTAGFTGADLENLMNEAAISAAREDRKFVTRQDIEGAFVKVGIGKEKKSKLISEKEKRITAYHEMGHAILFEVLPDVGPVHTVSIIPTGLGAAGYTMPLPEEDEIFNTRGKMLSNIMVSMGGRIAEEITFDDITTGASQDIKQATEVARNMVMKYGMSERIGFINYEQGEDSVFLGRDIGHVKNFGEETYNEIEAEVRKIIEDCYDRAKTIILAKKDILDRGAALLLEKEKLTQEEVEALFTEDTENGSERE